MKGPEMTTPEIEEHISQLQSDLKLLRNKSKTGESTPPEDPAQSLLEIKLAIAQNTKMTLDVEHAVHGNGKPGLVRQVDRLEWVARMQIWAAGLLVTALLGIGVHEFTTFLDRNRGDNSGSDRRDLQSQINELRGTKKVTPPEPAVDEK